VASEFDIDKPMDENFEEKEISDLAPADSEMNFSSINETGAEPEPEVKESDFAMSSVQQYLRDIGAVPLLSRAVDEPSAYEVVEPGTVLNIESARGFS
jgi:hypothetical protein